MKRPKYVGQRWITCSMISMYDTPYTFALSMYNGVTIISQTDLYNPLIITIPCISHNIVDWIEDVEPIAKWCKKIQFFQLSTCTCTCMHFSTFEILIYSSKKIKCGPYIVQDPQIRVHQPSVNLHLSVLPKEHSPTNFFPMY